MRTLMLVVTLAMLAVCVVGCVSAQDQERIDSLTKEEKVLWSERVRAIDVLLSEKKELRDALKVKIREIRTGVDDGTLTADKSKKFIAELRADIADTVSDVDNEIAAVKERFSESRERIGNEIDDLYEKGNSKLDIAGAFLLSLLTGGGTLGAVRLWRGSVNARAGDIGARTSP